MLVNDTRNLISLEVCIDSVESGLAAQAGGAHRVELCGNLNEGGTTPSTGMIHQTLKMLDIPVYAMIRPRGGDFLYSTYEYEVMKQEIATVKKLGCAGVVFGVLTPDGRIHKERTAEITIMAHPLKTTFHRAFDMTPNPCEALDCLVDLGLDNILTSGQKPTALEGMEILTLLVEQAKHRIEIIAGGGISSDNIAEIIYHTGVTAIHASASGTYESGMVYRNPDVTMTGGFHPSEYIRKQTQVERVRTILKSAVSIER